MHFRDELEFVDEDDIILENQITLNPNRLETDHFYKEVGKQYPNHSRRSWKQRALATVLPRMSSYNTNNENMKEVESNEAPIQRDIKSKVARGSGRAEAKTLKKTFIAIDSCSESDGQLFTDKPFKIKTISSKALCEVVNPHEPDNQEYSKNLISLIQEFPELHPSEICKEVYKSSCILKLSRNMLKCKNVDKLDARSRDFYYTFDDDILLKRNSKSLKKSARSVKARKMFLGLSSC
jgi:hypothetical protein